MRHRADAKRSKNVPLCRRGRLQWPWPTSLPRRVAEKHSPARAPPCATSRRHSHNRHLVPLSSAASPAANIDTPAFPGCPLPRPHLARKKRNAARPLRIKMGGRRFSRTCYRNTQAAHHRFLSPVRGGKWPTARLVRQLQTSLRHAWRVAGALPRARTRRRRDGVVRAVNIVAGSIPGTHWACQAFRRHDRRATRAYSSRER